MFIQFLNVFSFDGRSLSGFYISITDSINNYYLKGCINNE